MVQRNLTLFQLNLQVILFIKVKVVVQRSLTLFQLNLQVIFFSFTF